MDLYSVIKFSDTNIYIAFSLGKNVDCYLDFAALERLLYIISEEFGKNDAAPGID
jgi:hypothetical protein